MLTSDLVKPYVRQYGTQVSVDLLDEASEFYLDSAKGLIELFQRMVGRQRYMWWQAREGFEGTRIDYLRVRGLAKVLEDEATFTHFESSFTPHAVRKDLFSRGPVFSERDIFSPRIRDELLREVADELESTPEEVEAVFFADRPEEHILRHSGPAWTPLKLLQRYNLELARGVLYRATLLRIEIFDNFKEVFRYLKLFKVLYWCEEIDARGYRLTLSGPMSEFVLTERYGISFAEFMPALLLGERWRLTARIKPFQEKIPLTGHVDAQKADTSLLRYSLDHTCGLHSHYRRASPYDSALERIFASEFTDFEEKFGGERGHWKLLREQEVLVLGGTVMIPDFQLVNSLDERRKILIELVGFWSPTYLRNKTAKVRSANCPYLLLLVYEDLNVTREAFGEVASEIVFFKQKPIIKEIMPIIEAMAERVYGPLVKEKALSYTLEQLVFSYHEQGALLVQEEAWLSLTQLAGHFTAFEPSFSPRHFGCKDLATLCKTHEPLFEVRRAPTKGRPLQVRVRTLPRVERISHNEEKRKDPHL